VRTRYILLMAFLFTAIVSSLLLSVLICIFNVPTERNIVVVIVFLSSMFTSFGFFPLVEEQGIQIGKLWDKWLKMLIVGLIMLGFSSWIVFAYIVVNDPNTTISADSRTRFLTSLRNVCILLNQLEASW